MKKLSLKQKSKKLEQIAQEIAACKICQGGKIGKPVAGEGNPDAEIVFIGEAPGKKEAETGRPFVGRSGMLLRKLINEINLQENEVYITSPVKYLPKRGTPSMPDILHGKKHLDDQLEVIDPQLIVLLGATAAKALLPKPLPIQKMHGQIITEKGKKYFITYHPAAALRFPPLRKLLEEDFHKLKKNTS